MDVDECDFDMQLQDENGWDMAAVQDPLNGPPEEGFPYGEPDFFEFAPTEMDSSKEQPPGLPLVNLPIENGNQPEEEEEPSVRAASADPAPSGAVREPVARGEVGGGSQGLSGAFERRVRLFGKQRSPVPPMSLSVVGSADHYWGCLDLTAFNALSRRDKYKKVYNKIRWWSELVGRRAEEAAMEWKDFKSTPDLELIKNMPSQFRSMSSSEKCKLSKLFVASTAPPRHIMDYVQQQWMDGAVEDRFMKCRYLQAKSVLLTWNGDWGLFREIVGDVRGWKEVVELLKKNAQFLQLWQDFQAHVERLADVLAASGHACCMEVCMETLEESGVVRVHGHGFFNREIQKMQLYHGRAAAFMGSIPNKSLKAGGTAMRNSSANAGFFYICAPKIGGVVFHSSLRPYKDFQVNAEWIINLVQAEKMDFDAALREMVRCGKGFIRRVQDLKAWKRAKEELALEEHVRAEQQYHREANRGWKKFPEIEAWYERNTRPHLRRKEFLVVEGPSGLGKTEYIKALVGVEQVLELNADGMVKPVLRGFEAEQHTLVFWDELNVQLIVENRKLFQCPPCFLQVGFSPTGQHVYNVFLNKCVMAIGSNSWSEQVAALPKPGDRDWLRKNSVHIYVSEPMWVEEPVPEGSSQ